MLSDRVQQAIQERSDWKPKRRGERLHFRCPRHEDRNPSAWTGGGAWGCFACGFEESIATLAEILNVELNGDGPHHEYTVDEYAREKGFSVEKLQAWGLTNETVNGQPAIRIPYHDEAGEFLRARYRSRTGKWWEGRNRPIYPYGLERLADVRESGAVLIVEGESDCHALWHAGIDAIGIPGATCWKTEWASHLRGFEVYVWEEPGKAGAQFVSDVGADLPDAKVIRDVGFKDPADLYRSDRTGCADKIRVLMTKAVSITRSHRAPGRVRTLGEILQEGEGRAPEVVAPRLAWRGRVTLLAAREKLGKSTLAQAAAAAVSCGYTFLGESTPQGRVLFLSLDESVGDAARRLVRFGAVEDKVLMADRVSGDPASHLEELVQEHQPDLVVVDTLARFASGVVADPFKSSDWDRLLGPVCLTARDHQVGILLLGHAKKSDGKYRDSTAIGASVDVILEMDEGGESAVRNLEARGRWSVAPFAVRLVGNLEDETAHLRYDLDSGDLSLDARIILFIEQHPGCSTRDVRKGVTGRAAAITDALTELERRGVVVDDGKGQNRALYARVRGTGAEPVREPVVVPDETTGEPGRNHPGTTLGTGSGSRLYSEAGNHPATGDTEEPEEQPRLEDWI